MHQSDVLDGILTFLSGSVIGHNESDPYEIHFLYQYYNKNSVFVV